MRKGPKVALNLELYLPRTPRANGGRDGARNGISDDGCLVHGSSGGPIAYRDVPTPWSPRVVCGDTHCQSVA